MTILDHIRYCGLIKQDIKEIINSAIMEYISLGIQRSNSCNNNNIVMMPQYYN